MTSGLWLRLSGSVVLGLTLQACVSDVDPAATDPTQMGNGGSAGAGNTGPVGAGATTGGGNNTGGAGGGGGLMSDPTFGTGVHCPAPMVALMTDFTPPVAVVADAGVDAGADAGAPPSAAPAANINFGDFTNTLSGSSYVYPGDGLYPVSSDVSGGNWHITGAIGNYSGFGFSFSGPQPDGMVGGCYGTDASAYQGISFTIQGSVPMGNTITMGVGTSADDISHLWLNANAMPPPNPPGPPNNGRCIPASANQYDGSCAAPSFVVPVTAEATTITVMWAQLIGGRPAATVDPKEITNLAWSFPAPANPGAANAVTYNVDITIDNLRFIE